MENNKHWVASIVKSVLRFAGCGIAIIGAFTGMTPDQRILGFAVFFLIAEIAGVIEES